MHKPLVSTVTTIDLEQLKKQFTEAKAIRNVDEKVEKLIGIVHKFFHLSEWNLSMDAIKSVPLEADRNFLIAELIEEYLIPKGQLEFAHKCAKFLTPGQETTTLIEIRLALLENKPGGALELVHDLPTPISRNYALYHIVQYYLDQHDVENAMKTGDAMVENSRTIVNTVLQSQALRNVVKNLFLAHGNISSAEKVTGFIPDKAIRSQLQLIIDHFNE